MKELDFDEPDGILAFLASALQGELYLCPFGLYRDCVMVALLICFFLKCILTFTAEAFNPLAVEAPHNMKLYYFYCVLPFLVGLENFVVAKISSTA